MAFVVIVALIPLLGFVALGSEVASWYIVQQRAQNAADAAAIAGAETLAIQAAGSPTISDTTSYDTRAKQFAANNAFCDGGDVSGTCALLPAGTTQTVTISQPAADQVLATISQTQPTSLARLFAGPAVTMSGSATAQVIQPQDICALSLSGSLTLNGSPSCVTQSNADATNNGTGQVYAVADCHGTSCQGRVLPAAKPSTLQALDSNAVNSRTGNTQTCNGRCNTKTLLPNPTGAYGNLTVTTGDNVTLSGGTYVFSNAAIRVNAGTLNGSAGVTLVLLGTSSLSITGGTVNLSAPTSGAFNGVVVDNQGLGSTAVSGGTVSLGGATYARQGTISLTGTSQSPFTSCSVAVGASVTLGDVFLNTSSCDLGIVTHTQAARLMQ
jgi:hypothetical protein